MEVNKKNSNTQLEINNLIDDAVNNAVARRNQVEDSEDALVSLSNEEMANVAGGFAIGNSLLVKVPIICGGFPIPPLEQTLF